MAPDDALHPARLEALLREGGPSALLARLAVDEAPLARRLLVVAATVKDVLASAPAELGEQFFGRLARDEVTSGWLDALEATPPPPGPHLRLLAPTLEPPGSPLRTRFEVHGALVHAVVALPGGELAVSSGEDGGALKVFRREDGAVVRELEGHEGPVNHLALSPGGRALVSAGDDATVRLWDLQEGSCRVLQGHEAYVRQVAAAGDVVVSACEDKTARVWGEDGRLLRVLDHGAHAVMAVALSADGALCATSTMNSAVHLWDVASGRKIAQLFGTGQAALELPGLSGVFLGGTNYTGVGHENYPKSLRFDPGGRFLFTAERELIAWELETRREHARLAHLGWAASAMLFLEDGLVLLGGRGLHAFRVQGEKGELREPARVEWLWSAAHELEPVECLALGEGGEVLAGHESGEVSRWKLPPDPAWAARAGQSGEARSLWLSPDGSRATSRGVDGSVRLWDVRSASPLCDLESSLEPNGQALCFAAGGALLVSAREDEVVVHDAEDGAPLRRVRGPWHESGQSVMTLAEVPGRTAAVFAGASSRGAALWDVSGAGTHLPLEGYTNQTDRVVVTADGLFAVTDSYFAPEDEYYSSRSHLQGWDLKTGARLWSLPDRDQPGESYGRGFGAPAAVPGDATRVLTGDGEDGTRLFERDVRTGAVTRAYEVGGDGLLDVRARPDGRLVMVVRTSDGLRVVLADRSSGELDVVGTIAAGSDARLLDDAGRLVLVLGGAGVSLFEVPTGARLSTLTLGARAWALEVDRSARRAVVSDGAGRLHVVAIEKDAERTARARQKEYAPPRRVTVSELPASPKAEPDARRETEKSAPKKRAPKKAAAGRKNAKERATAKGKLATTTRAKAPRR